MVKMSEAKSFEFKEASDEPTTVYTVFGEKGVGKTAAAMTLATEGRTYVLSFDGMSNRVRTNLLKDQKERITVIDIVDDWDRDAEKITESSSRIFDYAIFILEEIEERGDAETIVIDGLEMFTQICEMKMRFSNQIGPFQGFKNLSLWKERRLYMSKLHTMARKIANTTLIYTTYTRLVDIDEDGATSHVKRPKWADIIEWQTDVLLEVFTNIRKKKGATLSNSNDFEPARFYATVLSSKIDHPSTGLTVDWTKKGLKEAFDASKPEEETEESE